MKEGNEMTDPYTVKINTLFEKVRLSKPYNVQVYHQFSRLMEGHENIMEQRQAAQNYQKPQRKSFKERLTMLLQIFEDQHWIFRGHYLEHDIDDSVKLVILINQNNDHNFQNCQQMLKQTVAQQYPHYQIFQFKTLDFHFYIIAVANTVYPVNVTLPIAGLLFNTHNNDFPDSIHFLLNTIKKDHRLSFNPQIYYNALQVFDQASEENVKQLQTLIEHRFNDKIRPLIQITKNNNEESYQSAKGYGLMKIEYRKSEQKTAASVFSLNAAYQTFNPIKEGLISYKLDNDEISTSFRQAITNQINNHEI